MQSAYMPCLGEGQLLQCRAMSQQATRYGPRRGPVLEPAEFWSHGNSTFWEPQCRPQSFRLLVRLLYAPVLVTRFASRVRAPVSESLCGPQNWTNAHSGQSIMKLAWCPESGPADWAENLNKKLLNGQRWLCPAPPQ